MSDEYESPASLRADVSERDASERSASKADASLARSSSTRDQKRDQKRTPSAVGGVAPAVACRAMELAIRHWQALKYGFICMDEDGAACYQIHPDNWHEGDYDYSVRWHEWVHQNANDRYMHDLQSFVEEGRERQVDTFTLNALFPQKKSIPWYMWGGALVGGGFFLKWLFSSPKTDQITGLPVVDTSAVENMLSELAGETPKTTKWEIKPLMIPGEVVVEEKK